MIKSIIKAMRVKGYAIFENDSKPLNLNYVGIRDTSSVGKFNDIFAIFWKYRGAWNQFIRYGTTDPGMYYLKNPLNVKGTAILKEGQMRGAFQLGKHRGKYEALVQKKEVVVIRDPNRDNVLDMGGVEDNGWHGINHHRAMSKDEASKVGKFSAGCQVTWNPHEYDLFIALCKEASEVWGNSFSYSLLNVNDLT